MTLSLMEDSRLFRGLSEGEAEQVFKYLSRRFYPKGAIIFAESDPSDSVFILTSGLIKLISISERGEETILRILKQGSMFGELLLADNVRCFTAVAITDVESMVISRDDFLRLLELNTTFCMNFIKILSRRVLRMGKEVADFGHTWSYQRLGIILLGLIDEHGVETPDGFMIPFPLTHEDLANLIGSTRETVTHQIKRLRRRGLLRRIGKHFVVDRVLLDKYIHS